MKSYFSHTSNFTKIIIIVEFLLIAYLLYALTVNVYQSYRIDMHIKNFEEENQRIEEENNQKSEDFAYFTSDAYIDKVAKQTLGLVSSGEEMIVIPYEDGVPPSGVEGDEDTTYQSLSNSQIWWQFFFGKNRFKN